MLFFVIRNPFRKLRIFTLDMACTLYVVENIATSTIFWRNSLISTLMLLRKMTVIDVDRNEIRVFGRRA